jgi:hypothetical protein
MINDVHKDAVIRTGDSRDAFTKAASELLGTGALDHILVDYSGAKVSLPTLAHTDTAGSKRFVRPSWRPDSKSVLGGIS